MQEADQINANPTGQTVLRISHAIFALVLIGLGIIGLSKGDFPPGWTPVPESMPVRQVLVYLGDIICIACGAGFLLRPVATIAARVLFAWLMVWLLFLRVPWMMIDFGIGTWWAASSTAILVGTSWVLYSSLANDWDKRLFGFVVGDRGMRFAQVLFGLGLIPLGIAHFLYLEATAPLVPSWLLFPVFWAYFTGAAFAAAGLGLIFGVYARLAATLITLQIALLTVFVWIPRIVTGNMTPFQWNEFVVSILLTTAAWVMTDSYRGIPWLAVVRRRSSE